MFWVLFSEYMKSSCDKNKKNTFYNFVINFIELVVFIIICYIIYKKYNS